MQHTSPHRPQMGVSRSSSNPIAIACNNNRYDETDSSSDEGSGGIVGELTGSYSATGFLGGNYSDGGMAHSFSSSRESRRRDMISSSGIARSLPPPRAPFLTSRNDQRDRLSSIPLMELPESAADEDEDGASSVQYGSLRNSHFNTDFGGRGANTSDSDAVISSSSAFHPHSLPTYMETDRYKVAQRWESERLNRRRRRNEAGNGHFSNDLHDSESTRDRNEDLHISGEHERGCEVDEVNNTTCHQLSSSLTAFDLMENSRQSGIGLSLNLSKDEVDSALESADRARRALREVSVDTWDQNRMEHGISGGPVEQIMIDDTGRDSDDYGRQDSPHNNPDAFDAFELDLDE